MEEARKRVLFTGYAPIHFVCFLPVYRLLAADPRVELFLSGGFKRTDHDEVTFSLEGFYDPFPVDQSRVLPIEEVRRQDFDVLVSAHLSDTLFPRSVNKTVQIFHGVSFKNLSVREKALRFDLLCLPGRYHSELYRRQGLVRGDGPVCLLTGLPKVDALATGDLDRDAVLRGAGVDPGLPTILFAPTGDKHNALDTMGPEVIRAVAEQGSWNLLIKPHDHPKRDVDWFAELAPMESDRVRLVRDRDIIPYLFAADLLMTDASSVAVEYTLMDRPIVFIDVPKLFKKLRKRAPALDLDTYGRKIGVVVKSPEEVVAAVSSGLAHPEREGDIRRAMATHVFYAPGGATERVAGVVLHAAGLAPGLPGDVEVLRPEDESGGAPDGSGAVSGGG
ncbi:MAG: CDP-glycerol glycerophosphotransferase family protein [Thermodesulfobacteriota bacterium]